MVGLWALITYIGAPLDAALGSHWGHYVKNFVFMFYCVALYPLVIKLTARKRAD